MVRLCDQAARYDPHFHVQKQAWSALDAYYIPCRYPNSLPYPIPAEIYNREMAQEALRLAEDVGFVEGKLRFSS